MNEAKQITMTSDPSLHSLMSELKAHISRELKGAVVEKPMCVKEAASYLGIHENTIYKRIKSGDLPHTLIHRINGSVYFFASELHEFIKRS